VRKTAVLSNLLLAFIASLLTPAQLTSAQSGLIMYDNFNQRFLNPSKWLTSSPCFTLTVLECAREIQNGHLRLEVRGYGATNSNTGNQYGESELHFLTPSRVRGIATQLTVRRTSAANCAASTDFNSGTQAILQGNFFNSGSGVPFDDVQALLFFNHLPTDPAGVLSAIAILNWQGQFFGGVELGTINVGQRVDAHLNWEGRTISSSPAGPTWRVGSSRRVLYLTPCRMPRPQPTRTNCWGYGSLLQTASARKCWSTMWKLHSTT